MTSGVPRRPPGPPTLQDHFCGYGFCYERELHAEGCRKFDEMNIAQRKLKQTLKAQRTTRGTQP